MRAILTERLERASEQVKSRQIELLAGFGDKADLDFYTEVLNPKADKPFEMEKSINRPFSLIDPDETDPDQQKNSLLCCIRVGI